MRRSLTVALLAFAFAFASGCTKEEPPPPPPVAPQPQPPPDRSAQDYYNDLYKALKPLFDAYEEKKGLSNNDRDGAIQALQTILPQVKATENGRAGIGKVLDELREAIMVSKEESRYKNIKGCCMAFRILAPENKRYAKLEKETDIILARPRVKLQGFFDVEGELYAFLQVTDVDTGKLTSYKVREGEVFHEVLRLNRMVGNLMAAEFEYLPAKFVWEEKSPAYQ